MHFTLIRLVPVLVSLAAGVAHALSLASWWDGQPIWWLQCLAMTVFAAQVTRAPDWHSAAWRAWLFAWAWLCGTFWWLFTAMHTYGGLAAPLAALAVAALAGFLALYHAVIFGCFRRFMPMDVRPGALLFVASWVLTEFAREIVFTGFPWGAAGYAHAQGPLAGYAPWIGAMGIGAVAALLAVLAALLADSVLAWKQGAVSRAGGWQALLPAVPGQQALLDGSSGGSVGANRGEAGGNSDALPTNQPPGTSDRQLNAMLDGMVARMFARSVLPIVFAMATVLALPFGLRAAWPAFTRDTGALDVTLLQGNIPQDEKFEPGSGVPLALRWYAEQLLLANTALVVAPETAIPLLPQQLPEGYAQALIDRYSHGGQAALVGIPLGNTADGYTNSVVGWKPGQTTPWRYDKHHLVPFGEFIPTGFKWFTRLMNIPLGDFERGNVGQPSFEWKGQRLAANVCYEDLFAADLGARFLDTGTAPTVFVNVSNLAWFGDGVALDQHIQIARMRALEFERPFLRATNTGATLIMDQGGVVQQSLPRGSRAALIGRVNGRSGETPFAWWVARFGLWPYGLASLAMLLFFWRRHRV